MTNKCIMFACQVIHHRSSVTQIWKQKPIGSFANMRNELPSSAPYSLNCFLPVRTFYNSNKYLFWEKDKKSGYGSKEKHSHIKMIRDGLKELRHEVGVWKDEMKEKFQFDPIVLYRPGETDVMWKFDSPKCLSTWVSTSDSDHGEGFSSCDLTITSGQKCLFSGTLNTAVPKDGRIKKAGYCNMKCHPARKSFKRDTFYDWSPYTHLVLRVRGDGRSYLLNLATSGYYDVLWNDVYHYVLFTRGGPYWQFTKIPFSKFFLGSKGRVQDKQGRIPLTRISSLGISVGDAINGPFNLEIDYIGLQFDPSHTEEFAYEMYQTGNFIVGT